MSYLYHQTQVTAISEKDKRIEQLEREPTESERFASVACKYTAGLVRSHGDCAKETAADHVKDEFMTKNIKTVEVSTDCIDKLNASMATLDKLPTKLQSNVSMVRLSACISSSLYIL